MNIATIAGLYRRPGPQASLYVPVVDADGIPVRPDVDGLAAHLVSEGAPAELAELAAKATVTSATDAGGVAVFAAPDSDPVVVSMPEAPESVAVAFGHVPYLSPLVEWMQLSVPHAVVEFGAEATDITVFPSFEPSWSTAMQTMSNDAEPIIATQLGALIRQHDIELVMLAGPSAGLATCGARLAGELPPTVRVVPIERAERPDTDELADMVVRLEADHSARLTKERIDRFTFERTHDNVAEGAAEALRALRQRSATLLLIHDDVHDTRSAFRSNDPVDVAESADQLGGGGGVVAGRLVDVAVGAAVNSGVEVRLIPAHVPEGPVDGIGVTVTP